MKLFLRLVVIFTITSFTPKYNPYSFPKVASYKELSIITQVDTLENGMVRVYFEPVTKRLAIKPGDMHVGDTIRGLILAKP